MAHQPVLPAENPDLHPARIKHVDRTPSDLRRQEMLGDDRKIGRRDHAAIEAADRRRDSKGLEQHAQAARAAGC